MTSMLVELPWSLLSSHPHDSQMQPSTTMHRFGECWFVSIFSWTLGSMHRLVLNVLFLLATLFVLRAFYHVGFIKSVYGGNNFCQPNLHIAQPIHKFNAFSTLSQITWKLHMQCAWSPITTIDIVNAPRGREKKV